MKRIEIVSSTLVSAVVILAAACGGRQADTARDTARTDSGDVSTPGATTYEIRASADGRTDRHDIVIYNVTGHVDSVINKEGLISSVLIFGIAGDSVSTGGPPLKGPPKQWAIPLRTH